MPSPAAWHAAGLHPDQLQEPALSAACQAGLINNLNDAVAWGLFPILFATYHLTLTQIGLLGNLPGLLGHCAARHRRPVGPHRPQVAYQHRHAGAGALALVARGTSYGPWIVAVTLLGLGTAMVYPTLLAVVGDVAHPIWRGRAVGVYRLWRDSGFAAGGGCWRV